MRKADLQRYQNRLVELRERLRGEVNRMIENLPTEERPQGEHELKAVPSDYIGKDIALENLEENIEHAIKDALERIENGTYGTCQECGKPIPKARLDAIPYTPYCVQCERKFEAE